MSAPETTEPKVETQVSNENNHHINIESVNRVAKLPVVEAAIHKATGLYEMAKDSNSVVNYALTTCESTVKTGMEKISPLTTPVVASLEGPIKKVDGILCSGLDYVEDKVPCVKLPPNEMYENTKNYINETVQPAVQTARNIVEPTVERAKHIVEPAVETAKGIVEPMIETAKHTAVAAKDYGLEKVEELVKGKKPDATTDGEVHLCERHSKKE